MSQGTEPSSPSSLWPAPGDCPRVFDFAELSPGEVLRVRIEGVNWYFTRLADSRFLNGVVRGMGIQTDSRKFRAKLNRSPHNTVVPRMLVRHGWIEINGGDIVTGDIQQMFLNGVELT